MVKWIVSVVAALVFLSSCSTVDTVEPMPAQTTVAETGQAAEDQQPVSPEPSQDETPGASPDSEIARLFEQAETAENQGLYAQAMTLYLRVKETAPSSAEGREANAKLGEFASGLRMEAGEQWLDAGGRLGAQYAMDLVTIGGPLPSVQLTYNDGPARFTVAAMPVRFSVVEGEAAFADLVNTSDFGTAAAPVLAITLGESPIVVEATPVLLAGDTELTFDSASVRFIYNPPSTPAVLLTSLLDAEGVSPAPTLADAILPAVESAIGSATVLSANMLGADATPLIRGVARKVQELAREMDTPVVIVGTAELERISQVQFEGRDYNIYQAFGRVRVEVRGITGGQVLFSLASDELQGQGGSEEAARLDLLELAAEAIQEVTDELTAGLRTAIRIDLE